MELLITALNHQGLGVAHHEGKAIFVSNALPGEKVIAKVTKQHKRYDNAMALEILEPSAMRVAPICPHFQVCGGCALQHMASTAQIELKQNVLLEQLKHFAAVTPESVSPPIVSQTHGYRRKARLGVKFVEKKNKLLIGFREQNNRFLADLETCKVLLPQVGESFGPLRDTLMQLSQYRAIAQIELAAGDDAIGLIIRHLAPLTAADVDILIAYAKTHQVHIYLQPGGPLTVHRIWPQTDEVSTYTIKGNPDLKLQFHPLDFIQVNAGINQLMVERVLDALNLTADDRVLDLFSGLGNFTLPIASLAKHVVGVEGSQEMVERLLANALRNNLANIQAFAWDLTKPIDHLPWSTTTYDKIVIDPPRAGALEVVEHIKRFQAKTIVYISCHIATLARDSKIILEQGYRLKTAGVIDMFPHTMHVESMAVFERT